jgi:hypothetical protein
MSFAEKLEIILSGDAKGAVKAFAETAVAAQESAAKQKAAAGEASAANEAGAVKSAEAQKGASESGIASMGGMVTAVGAAGIAVFELSKKWEEAALSAGQMADATGLNSEEASRWSVVAKNADVDTGALAKSLGLLEAHAAKTPKMFTDIGVAVVDSAGKARSTNAIYLDTIDALGKMEDSDKRILVSKQLLGKGFQATAELIAEGSKKLRADLAAVDASQVFKDKDVADARAYRDALKELGNQVQALEMEIGKSVVPIIEPLVSGLGKVLKVSREVTGAVSEQKSAWETAGSFAYHYLTPVGLVQAASEKVGHSFRALFDDMSSNKGITGSLSDETERLISVKFRAKESADANAAGVAHETKMLDAYRASLGEGVATFTLVADAYSAAGEAARLGNKANADYAAGTKAAEQATTDHAKALKNEETALEHLIGVELSAIDKKYAFQAADSSAIDAIGKFNKVLDDHKSTLKDIGDASLTAGESIRHASKAFADSKGDIASSGQAINDQITYLYNEALALDPASPLRVQILGYIADLQKIPNSVTTTFTAIGAGAPKVGGKPYASGTDSATAGVHLVGEAGPELVQFAGGESVYPADKSAKIMADSRASIVQNVTHTTINPATAAASSAAASAAVPVDETAIARLKYERGVIDLAQFRAILVAKKAGLEQYSTAEDQVYKEIAQLDAKKAADETAAAAKKAADDKTAAAQFRVILDNQMKYEYDEGQISLLEYKQYLAGKLDNAVLFSNEWIALENQMETVQKAADASAAAAAKKSAADASTRIADIVAKAKAAADLIAAIDAEAAAAHTELVEKNEATWINASTETDKQGNPVVSQTQKDTATAKAAGSRAAHVLALIKGADARANAEGYKDDSPDWNASVRQSISDYEAGNSEYNSELNAYVATLPKFHRGGRIPGTPGQEVPIMAMAGETVLNSSNAGYTDNRTFHINLPVSLMYDRARARTELVTLLREHTRLNPGWQTPL